MLTNKNYDDQQEESRKTPKSPLPLVRYLVYATIVLLLLAAVSYKDKSYAAPEEENKLVGLMQELGQDPNNPARLTAVGQEFMAQGDFSNAIDFFEKAKQIEPNNAELLYNLGSAQLKSNKADAAEKNFKAVLALKANPQITNQTYYSLALLYIENEPLKAKEYLEEIVRSQEASPELKQSASELLRNLQYTRLD